MPTGIYKRTKENNRINSESKKGKKRKPFSVETKKKMSEAGMGKIISEEQRRKLREANKGKKHSVETRIKMSKSHRGSKCHLWRGGITKTNRAIRNGLEYRLWREVVFKRDNYKCIWCGDDKGGNLNADHIKSFAYYPELRFAIDNGRTLCEPCHKTTDTYGVKNRWNKNNEG